MSNFAMFRQLCLDALVEEGDRNFDWRLSFEEYKLLLSDSYKPSRKRKFYHNIVHFVVNCLFFIADCSLNGKMHEDGAETRVECNGW